MQVTRGATLTFRSLMRLNAVANSPGEKDVDPMPDTLMDSLCGDSTGLCSLDEVCLDCIPGEENDFADGRGIAE